jgi:hypothetical protein
VGGEPPRVIGGTREPSSLATDETRMKTKNLKLKSEKRAVKMKKLNQIKPD